MADFCRGDRTGRHFCAHGNLPLLEIATSPLQNLLVLDGRRMLLSLRFSRQKMPPRNRDVVCRNFPHQTPTRNNNTIGLRGWVEDEQAPRVRGAALRCRYQRRVHLRRGLARKLPTRKRHYDLLVGKRLRGGLGGGNPLHFVDRGRKRTAHERLSITFLPQT